MLCLRGDGRESEMLLTETVYEHMGDDLRRYLRRRLPDADAAEDVLQDVFVRVHNHLDTLDDDDALAGWLYRIASNRIADYYRKRSRQAVLRDADAAATAADVDEGDEAEREALRNTVAGWIVSAIEELPGTYREAVRLAEIEGLTQAEIADRLGLSVSGAKSRVQRGRRLVRDSLVQCCHFHMDRLGRVFDAVPRRGCCSRESQET